MQLIKKIIQDFTKKLLKKSNRPKVAIVIFLVALAVMNQNCSKNGFQSNVLSMPNQSSGTPTDASTTTTTSSTTTTSASRCNLPWGGTIMNGQTVTAYQAASVPNGQTCVSQTRSCASGTLSGTYQFENCYVQAPVGNGDITAAHPRLLLDTATLSRLRANAAANSPAWQKLKAYCDNYVGGSTNYPDQNGYPDAPVVGQGYQGTGYLPIILAEGLCYQVLKTSNPTLANTYGDKVVQVLMAMSQPYPGTHGENPLTDSGYVIRFFGQGYGFGYDWVYDRLTAAQRTQIYTVANKWTTAFETGSFEYAHPQSNYYAGYFAAKAAIAISTYGDNPTATSMWNDWMTKEYTQRVQPYYMANLNGGGWPEGFGNYGSNATLNMSSPIWMVKSATGTDLVHATQSFDFPTTIADYLMHFTWPSRDYIDDRDTNHANGATGLQVGTADTGMFQHILGSLRYWGAPHADIFAQYGKEVATATGGFGLSCRMNGTEANTCWSEFLYEDTGATAPVNTLPLSYLASGLGSVAARSDWTNSASWMSFRAAPYVNYSGQGEEGFDQGSLALVRGKTPLLVNATGWTHHEPNGSADEELTYNDLYGSFSANNIYSGNRQIYNVFYVRNMNGSSLVEPFGQAAYARADGVQTQISAFEDGTSYVYSQATKLEQMYRKFKNGAGVSNWSRQIVYLRPNRFVVYDRTAKGDAAYDQYMAWHFPANPTAGTAPAGEKRLDVTYNSACAGSMTVVLPVNASVTTVGMYPQSNPVKAWQVQVRPADSGVSQQWLTVFDLSTSSGAVATASKVTVTQGNAVGVLLTAADGNSVVLNNAGAIGTTISGSIVYTIPNATTKHIITELPTNTSYSVSVSISGGNKTITVAPGTGSTTSAKGVLSFTQ
jgi:hypothetical protein